MRSVLRVHERPILFAAALAASVLVGAAAGKEPPRGYTGAKACGTCHETIYQSWQKTAHARASSVERLGERASDPACLVCHATGPGASPSPRLPGVQCEACHGAGAAYSPEDIMKNPFLARALGLRDLSRVPETSCLPCHSVSLDREPFDFAAAWAKIAHGEEAP